MSGKKDPKPPQDLSALDDTYQIVGELSARDHMREYLARRRSDGADVQVLIAEAPRGDTGNALPLFAADVNLLATLEHRNLIPIHEGRWIGQDRFAVVTDRCAAPTLETLVARGESWSYPRIGAILHEINGLLEWARQQKVVHRTLSVDTLHLEPGTDRVLASFVAQPLTRQGSPGPSGDAHTIATVAWTLITRGRDLPATAEDSLGVVRPELPRRLVEATDALLHGQRIGDTEPPAVLDYIAMVAMTEAVMRGEVYAAELEATIYHERMREHEEWADKEQGYQTQLTDQEHRIEGERQDLAALLETERAQMASERATLQQQMVDERALMERTLAEERALMERTLGEERSRMANERAELEQRMAAERAELEQRLADERAELARQHTELEQRVAAERDELSRHRVALEDRYAQSHAEIERTLAEERALMEQTMLEERTRLETTLSEGQQRLLADRTSAEDALARTRAELEEQIRARREELETQLAREREEFDRAMIAERQALEADKEGFAIYNAAERDGIEAERRALEELYQAYEAEGHVIEHVDDDLPPRGGRSDQPIPGLPPALADLAPIAAAQPVSEPQPDPGDPAETDAGLTKAEVRRSRRAAWGIPASVILLVAVVTATAVGIGVKGGSGDTDTPRPAERTAAAAPAAPTAPARRLAPRPAPTVVDSAGGSIVMPDSAMATVRKSVPTTQRRPPERASTNADPPARPAPQRQVVNQPPSPSPQQTDQGPVLRFVPYEPDVPIPSRTEPVATPSLPPTTPPAPAPQDTASTVPVLPPTFPPEP